MKGVLKVGKIELTGKKIKIDKPCYKLKYCPYGPLVEKFPLREEGDKMGCGVFGHQCPVFSVAEAFEDILDIEKREIKGQAITEKDF